MLMAALYICLKFINKKQHDRLDGWTSLFMTISNRWPTGNGTKHGDSIKSNLLTKQDVASTV